MSFLRNASVAVAFVGATVFSVPPAVAAAANPAAAPSGKTVLTVKSATGQVDLDMAALEKLPQHTFTTRTPWYPEARTFTGPLLRDLLAATRAQGRVLRAVALNDYKVELPTADATRFDVIVARLMDGKAMPVRDKGPLFIVYPFDTSAELRSEKYFSRSAWQLRTLEVE